MFVVGDKVFVEQSAVIDLGYTSYCYIMAHPYATITAVMATIGNSNPNEAICCLEWPEEFPGGWDCYGHCKPRQGQQVTSKHLSLDFEGSREVTTVPNIEGYDE